MTSRRRNELRDEEVVFAVGRQDRTFLPTDAECPLCPTRPGGPATEIPRSSFELAVFENRFPTFASPRGAAEVVVYTDDHDSSFGRLPLARAEALMWVWRDRYQELGDREGIEYVLVFENRGVEVGVTLHHPHGQIYAFPFLPPVPRLEREADLRLGGCAPCALLEREHEDGRRLVIENDAATAYVPWAARWPYEVHVVMREHRASLLALELGEMRDLADALQAVTRGYDALFGCEFPYVMVVHQAPTDGGEDGHLHVEFYPPRRSADKLKYPAGCEQGAGTFINDTLPEATAGELREAIRRARP